MLQVRSVTAVTDERNCCESVISPRKSVYEGMFCIFFPLDTVDRLGKLVVAGGAAVGLGALCYYGMGMSSEIGAIERAV